MGIKGFLGVFLIFLFGCERYVDENTTNSQIEKITSIQLAEKANTKSFELNMQFSDVMIPLAPKEEIIELDKLSETNKKRVKKEIIELAKKGELEKVSFKTKKNPAKPLSKIQNEELKSNVEVVDKNDEVEQEVVTTQSSVEPSSVSVQSNANIDPTAMMAKNKRFGANFRLEAETDFNQVDNEDKYYGSNFTTSLMYKLDSQYTVGTIVIIEKNLSSSYEEKFSGLDSRLFIRKNPIFLSEKLILAPSLRFVYPTSNTSKVRDEMIAGFELDPTLNYQISNKLSFTYLPRLRKDFHKYTTNRQDRMNSEYRVLQFYSLTYSFTEKLFFSPTLLYSNRWSYSGRQQTDSYLTVLDLSYNYSQKLTFGISTLTGGAVYQTERGPDEGIQWFDENSTTFVTSVTIRM